MSKNLLSKKSALTSRRNIVIYIIATILILGIVAGFSNTFYTDNTRHSASYGETIVIETEPPASGTPEDYDLLSNLKFTAYKLHHSKYFKGFTKGTVSADIGIGSYTQYLTNTRIVYNETTVFAETISSSSLKSLAEQKYIENNIVIYRPADKINGDNVTYKSTAMQMSFDDFSGKYGSVPNQLSKYIINEETILAVKDENATVAAPLNSDGGEVGFDVPDKLVPNSDGNYVFTLTLDPVKSSLYYRNEVRTLGGADQNPKFYSVQITVTVNSDWIPLSTRTLEVYDIEIPVLGAMRCSGDNFEEFSMIDDPNGEIPEKDFFQPYVDQAKADPDYVPPVINVDGPLSASDYLASAFACYLSGEKNLDLTADIQIDGIPVIGGLSAYDLTLSINLDTLDIQAMLADGLYVKYSGGKVYIKNNDINGYIDVNDIEKLTSDETLKGLLSGMGELDLTKIFGGDMLDVIFRDCEMTTENGVTEIPMAFTLDLSGMIPTLDSVKVNASISINDDDKSLKSITGKVTIGDVVVDINVQPIEAPEFPTADGAVDMSGMLDFVPDILSTATQKTYGIDGEITINDMTVGVSAYIDRTNGLKADAVLNVMGMDVNVKYVEDVIYIDALGVNVRGTVEELPALLEAALDLTGFNKYQNLLKAMLPSSVNEIVDILKSLSVDDSTLEFRLEFIGIPIDVKLTRGDGKLSSLALAVDVDLFGIKANVAADLKLSEPTAHEVTAPTAESYLTFTDLATLITDAKPYLQDTANYTAKIDGSVEINGKKTEIGGSFVIDKILDNRKNVTGVAADGTLNVFGHDVAVTYVNGAAYVAIGEIKAMLNLTDASDIISSALEVVELITGENSTPEIDIIGMLRDGAIKSVSMNGGTLNAALAAEGCDVTVALNLKTGKIGITAKLDGITVELDLTVAAVKKNHNITAPDGAYINAAELSTLIDAAKAMIEQKSAVIPVAVTCDGKTYNATIAVDFSDGIKAQITAPEFGLDIVLVNDTAYVSVGQVKLCGSLAQAKELYAEVRKHLPALPELGSIIAIPQDLDVNGIIDTVFGAVKSLTGKDGVIYAGIEFDGFGVSASMANDLSEITASANGVTIVMNPEITAVAIDEPSGTYNSISQLTALVPTVFELIDSTAFGVAYDVTAAGYKVDGNAILDIANGIKANATANAFGQTVSLSYIEDSVYVGLQAIRVKLATADTEKWLQPITNLLDTFGISLPDIGEITNGLKDDLTPENIISYALTAVDSIKSFSIADGAITVNIEYGEYAAKLTLTVASDIVLGATVDVKLDINGVGSVNATVAAATEQIVEPEYETYSDVTELLPAIEAVAQIVTERGMSAVATVAIGDITLEAKIEGKIEKGTLNVLVTEDTLGLKVTLIGDTAYIEIGGIKVSGQLNNVTDLIAAIIPNLPYTLQPYVAEMNDQMMSIIPSEEELGTADGEIDIANMIGLVLDALKRLSVSDNEITIEIRRSMLSATLGIATDLSRIGGNIALTFKGIGGPFGDCYVRAFDLGLNDIAAKAVTVPQIEAKEYVPASDIISIVESIMPLVEERALELDINVTVFGQEVVGNIYIDFGEYTLDTVAVKAKLTISDASVTVAVIEKTLYLDINNGSICVAQPLTKSGVKSLIAQLDEALPELGLSDKISQKLDELKSVLSEDINIADILQTVTLSPIADGMKLRIETNDIAVEAGIVLSNTVIAIDVACDIGEKAVTIGLNATKNANGVITNIVTTEADIMGTELKLGLSIASAEFGKAEIEGDYITVDDIVPYINPIMDLINNAQEATTITIDLSEMTLDVMGKTMNLAGKVDISLDPIEVYAVITLFAGTTDKIDLTVIYANDIVYIELGEIRLSFDINNDVDKLLEAVQDYLPPSLKNIKDFKAISKISSLIKDVKAIAKTTDISETMSILFGNNDAYGKNMAKQILDMLRLGKFNDKLTMSLTVMETPEITLNVKPIIDNGYLDFEIDAKLSNMLNVGFTAKLAFTDAEFNVSAPDADNYVSVVDFVTTVVNAVNTLTAKMPETETTENGVTTKVKTIAFSADSFAFDYDIFKVEQTVDENGETVDKTDEETGRVVIEEKDGQKVVKQHIDVNSIAGKPALAFKYVTTTVTENGVTTKSSKVYIEAHITLGIKELDAEGNLTAKLGFPIELNLYVAPTEQYPDGLAYLYYKEANEYGEKISLDYNSIMEIVAAALDILSVDDQTVESLLGKYRLDIDKTVFESMSIAGLDSITTLLNNLIKAVDEAKLALKDVKDALNIVYTEDDLTSLLAQFRNDKNEDGTPTAKTLLANALAKVKAIIAGFATDKDGTKVQAQSEGDEQEPTAEDNSINGALFGKVVNAISFAFTDNTLSATVDNSIATGTAGEATVEVTSKGKKINSIGVDNLDVNKAKLNTFDLQFTAGEDLDDSFTIAVPTDEFTTSGNVTYSNLANIKHLLFDVMNTANMLEFEIGGFDTTDGIGISLHIGELQLKNVQIKIDAKVKILDRGKDADPRYSTAADIELHIPKMTWGLGIVLPECTTRLFFYDDVIYIVGQNWQHGTRKDNITVNANIFKLTYWKIAEVQSAFTVPELGYMMKNDIETFLKEFVFRLLPLSRCVNSLADMDIQQTIIDSIKKEGKDENNTKNTLAQIFKSYQYNNGSHDIVIGLAELAGSTALSDVSLSLIGANDGDTNILDNYIQRLTVATSMVGLIDVSLDVSLRNVSTPTVYYTDKDFKLLSPNNATTEFKRNELESTGLSSTTINGTKYTIDGTTATVYSNRTPTGKDSNVISLIDTILASVTRDKDGKVSAVTNRDGGIQWDRPWKAAYEASLTA